MPILGLALDKGILKEYLGNREKEVVDIMMALFDQEEVFRVYVKETVKEAVAEAVESSICKAIEMCQEFGLSITDAIARIASKFNLSQEDSKEMVERFWK